MTRHNKSASRKRSSNVNADKPTPEWPTLALIIATYGVFGVATSALAGLWLPGAIVTTGLAITMFSSLQHEALHGHPFRKPVLNEFLVFPAITLTVPYRRFRDTHLAHHHDPILTDPYDDPETNYLDPAVWARLPPMLQWVLRLNNTLLGRVILGPLISNATWLWSETRLILSGNRDARLGWALHMPGLLVLALWLHWAGMPIWAYLLAAWVGHGILKIRTFLEHRAHDAAPKRTVAVEDSGPLAFLFLNNNLHVVHHKHPNVAWYRLPALYKANRDRFLHRNGAYHYQSYAEVIRRYLLRGKDPVMHPLWSESGVVSRAKVLQNVGASDASNPLVAGLPPGIAGELVSNDRITTGAA